MARTFLAVEGVSVQLGGTQALKDVNFTINEGEQWAVLGPSGSGKTVLAHTLCGLHFHSGEISYGSQGQKPRIAMVDQQHKFKNRQGMTDLYYQQRFNSSDADQTMTVADELAGYEGWDEAALLAADPLHIRALLDRPLIQLSNGENKRVQLAIALLEEPELLILDNPFLGLDVEGRAVLHGIIDSLAARGMHILLITGPGELPQSITHIARLEKGQLTHAGPREGYKASPSYTTETAVRLDEKILARIRSLTAAADVTFEKAVKMVGVTVTYGDKVLLDHIDWEVGKGDKWNVSGPNGAGKSTILSLITGDNPQAYANEIYLFDRKRGSGESIWDIKKNIGFVSPELHLYFDLSATCFDVVGSGLFDTIGLFRQLNDEQRDLIDNWMKLLSLEDLRTRRLAQLSTGQQRMVLLARALIKNPPVLILDEPCQGLDEAQTIYFRDLIGELSTRFDKTLIYVSHYKQELPTCIDKFLRLDNGKLST